MARLFLGIAIPESVAVRLTGLQGGIRGARWEPPEKLHLTLHFLGEVDGGTARRLVDALGHLESPAFDLELHGVGYFPPRGTARSLWVGVRRNPALLDLHRRTGRILERLGLDRDRRAFSPHVTIARLKQPDMAAVAGFVVRHATFSVPPFRVDRIVLFRSVLGKRGSHYRFEAVFPLGPKVPCDTP